MTFQIIPPTIPPSTITVKIITKIAEIFLDRLGPPCLGRLVLFVSVGSAEGLARNDAPDRAADGGRTLGRLRVVAGRPVSQGRKHGEKLRTRDARAFRPGSV